MEWLMQHRLRLLTVRPVLYEEVAMPASKLSGCLFTHLSRGICTLPWGHFLFIFIFIVLLIWRIQLLLTFVKPALGLALLQVKFSYSGSRWRRSWTRKVREANEDSESVISFWLGLLYIVMWDDSTEQNGPVRLWSQGWDFSNVLSGTTASVFVMRHRSTPLSPSSNNSFLSTCLVLNLKRGDRHCAFHCLKCVRFQF